MKTIIITAVLIFMVSVNAMANKVVAKGSSNSSFGNYKIERLAEHMVLNGKELDKELLSNGFGTSMEKLNREVYFHQKVIASQTIATVDHLELIAAYYPELFKRKVFHKI